MLQLIFCGFDVNLILMSCEYDSLFIITILQVSIDYDTYRILGLKITLKIFYCINLMTKEKFINMKTKGGIQPTGGERIER